MLLHRDLSARRPTDCRILYANRQQDVKEIGNKNTKRGRFRVEVRAAGRVPSAPLGTRARGLAGCEGPARPRRLIPVRGLRGLVASPAAVYAFPPPSRKILRVTKFHTITTAVAKILTMR